MIKWTSIAAVILVLGLCQPSAAGTYSIVGQATWGPSYAPCCNELIDVHLSWWNPDNVLHVSATQTVRTGASSGMFYADITVLTWNGEVNVFADVTPGQHTDFGGQDEGFIRAVFGGPGTCVIPWDLEVENSAIARSIRPFSDGKEVIYAKLNPQLLWTPDSGFCYRG